MSLLKIDKVNSYEAKEWNGKYFHEFSCDGKVDGSSSSFVVSIFGVNKDKPTLPISQDIECEFSKEFKGVKQFKYKPARSGGGGGFKSAPRNETSIIAQCCLKAAVDYAKGNLPDCSPEDVTEVAGRFMKWVKENS